jgi:hypothetical protein
VKADKGVGSVWAHSLHHLFLVVVDRSLIVGVDWVRHWVRTGASNVVSR